tara:strand:+ start:709 stop:819 length:111 start_codon:yes stop_codon:yes gene_type:complete
MKKIEMKPGKTFLDCGAVNACQFTLILKLGHILQLL